MKNMLYTGIIYLLLFNAAFAQQNTAQVVTTDIANFWAAYDKITAAKDSSTQYACINQLFINKGTPGLKAIMQARNYTPQSYIDAINHYPLFWQSIRSNTLKAGTYANAIAANIAKLKKLYPQLKPATIYFTIGALKTGGTTLNGMVLIGSEIALTNEHTATQEFPASLQHLKDYAKTNPARILVFTNVHEYVHTQQKTTIGNTLLAQAVLEGVAELMAEKATGKSSTLPAISYGKLHSERVKQVFASQMFNDDNGFWLYSNDENEFNQRDLGYYVGHTICEQYFNKATNKQQAIKEMIELDYNNEAQLNRFVNHSGYFQQPVEVLKAAYENRRPYVLAVDPLQQTPIDPATTKIIVSFSTAMNNQYMNFELGPLGIDYLLKRKAVTFSADGKAITLEVNLAPGRQYQLVLGSGFKSLNGAALKPYLLTFTTAAK